MNTIFLTPARATEARGRQDWMAAGGVSVSVPACIIVRLADRLHRRDADVEVVGQPRDHRLQHAVHDRRVGRGGQVRPCCSSPPPAARRSAFPDRSPHRPSSGNRPTRLSLRHAVLLVPAVCRAPLPGPQLTAAITDLDLELGRETRDDHQRRPAAVGHQPVAHRHIGFHVRAVGLKALMRTMSFNPNPAWTHCRCWKQVPPPPCVLGSKIRPDAELAGADDQPLAGRRLDGMAVSCEAALSTSATGSQHLYVSSDGKC